MSDPLPISVTAGSERPSARQQIQQILDNARASGDPLRVRIPVSLYNVEGNRSYLEIRDAAWNLSYDSATMTAEMVEELIRVIGKCIVAVASEGAQVVARKLDAADAPGA